MLDWFKNLSVTELLGGAFLLAVFLALLFALLRTALWRALGAQRAVDREISRRKSSEVRTGKIVEVLAPMLSDFPVDVKAQGSSTVFLGQPVDYVHFNPDGSVTFIEVKSGNSRLSESQERIKAAVLDGRVSWAVYRVKG